MQRELNRKVAATLGDPDKLRRLQVEYGRKPNEIYVWNRVFDKIWDKRKRELGLYGNTSRYA